MATEADLAEALFGPRPAAEVLIACKDGTPAAFALFFHNFSTFLGRRGLWLEDLFVQPAYRRQGCAQALLRALAGIARDRGCGRFEWAVLDWNASAIEFYQSLGATVLPDWRIVRVVGTRWRRWRRPGPDPGTPSRSAQGGSRNRRPGDPIHAVAAARPASPSGSTPAAAACTASRGWR